VKDSVCVCVCERECVDSCHIGLSAPQASGGSDGGSIRRRVGFPGRDLGNHTVDCMIAGSGGRHDHVGSRVC
jgi:hypothetical protein